MYFPYLRGRQFELLALRELLEKGVLGSRVVPVIEPVKLSSTLVKTIELYGVNGRSLAIITNPKVGSFESDTKEEKNQKLRESFSASLEENNYIIFMNFLRYDQDYLTQHSLLTTNSWDDFVNALKTKNRFHTHYIDLNLLERFCSYIRKPYKEGAVFFRCRISMADGIPIEEMGAPPVEKTSDGRANARGIQCLYLGDTAETTIYEIRAGAYDYVTVGKFRLTKDIIVVDLKKINQISPFIEGLDCLEYAINKEHLNKINNEMGKIMRRSDSVLDYLPTQYITDFVKSIVHDGVAEYAGIEYKSVMHSDGYNLALFDPSLFECISTEVYRIDMIDY